MSELLRLQFLFARLVPRLLDYVYELGFSCSLGEALRTKEQAEWNAARGVGIKGSLHIQKLAIDLNLFTSTGVPLFASEDHAPIGAWWKAQNPLCRWGGDFKRRDGGHYSITYQGRA